MEPGDPRLNEVNESNCFNSQHLGIADIYTITVRSPTQGDLTSDAEHRFWYHRRHDQRSFLAYLGWLPVVFGGLWVLL